MHIPRGVGLALGAVVLALVTPLAQTAPGAQTPTFRLATNLVPVDVRVLDRDGKPVTDLAQSDFTVLEDGVIQDIRHFSTQAFVPQALNAPRAVASPAPARPSSSDQLPVQNYRVFLIVLGRGRLQPPANGVDGMLHFVRDRLLPQDRVAVVAWNRASDFTTDHAKIAALLERFKRLHEGIESRLKLHFSGLTAVYGSREMPASVQTDIDTVFGGRAASRTMAPALIPESDRVRDDTRRFEDLLQTTTTLDSIDQAEVDRLGMTFDEFVSANTQSMQDLRSLYTAVEYLRHIDGEKHLVFAAETALMLPRVEDDRNLANTASDARVVIDYVHTGGQISLSSGFTAEARGRARGPVGRANVTQMNGFATARTLATLTGGSFFGNQFPKIADAMDRIDQSARFQYVLGYYTSRPTFDGRYRRIVVRVNRPGLTVLFRHGYFARADIAPFNRRGMLTYSRMSAAARYDQDVHDITVRATASAVTTDSVHVEMTIDPSRVAFETSNTRHVGSIELAVFAIDGDAVIAESWQTLALSFTDPRYEDVKRTGIAHAVDLAVPSRAKSVKVVVYDYGADLVGSALIKIP